MAGGRPPSSFPQMKRLSRSLLGTKKASQKETLKLADLKI
jgi:hypothetical protein